MRCAEALVPGTEANEPGKSCGIGYPSNCAVYVTGLQDVLISAASRDLVRWAWFFAMRVENKTRSSRSRRRKPRRLRDHTTLFGSCTTRKLQLLYNLRVQKQIYLSTSTREPSSINAVSMLRVEPGSETATCTRHGYPKSTQYTLHSTGAYFSMCDNST
jgi:hypothetical protein